MIVTIVPTDFPAHELVFCAALLFAASFVVARWAELFVKEPICLFSRNPCRVLLRQYLTVLPLHTYIQIGLRLAYVPAFLQTYHALGKHSRLILEIKETVSLTIVFEYMMIMNNVGLLKGVIKVDKWSASVYAWVNVRPK